MGEGSIVGQYVSLELEGCCFTPPHPLSGLSDITSSRCSWWPSSRTWCYKKTELTEINIRLIKPSPWQWPKVGCGAAKWQKSSKNHALVCQFSPRFLHTIFCGTTISHEHVLVVNSLYDVGALEGLEQKIVWNFIFTLKFRKYLESSYNFDV